MPVKPAVPMRLVTFSYFIPTMVGMMGSESLNPEVKATLSQWLMMNHGRHVLSLLGWLCALKALSLSSIGFNITPAKV